MKLNSNKVTILVNTSDGFEDCWDPFFKLFSIYWNDCPYSILLNTEKKVYKTKHSNLKIRSSQVSKDINERRLSWSDCLIKALNQIDTPLVLYLQEDYFIKQIVQTRIIEKFTQMMTDHKEIKNIGLTYFGSYPPFENWNNDPLLKKVSKDSKYRISTQASLWNKETLLSYLDKNESGWMFEIFGTQRAKKRNDIFLTVNREIFTPEEGGVINYTNTGIVKGKWHPEIAELFEDNGINMDFSKRGFYKPRPFLLWKYDTAKKFMKYPGKLLKYIFNQYIYNRYS